MINRLPYTIDEALKFLARARERETAREIDESNCSEFVHEEGGWRYVAINFWHDKGVVCSEVVYCDRLKILECDFYLPTSDNKKRNLGDLYLNVWRSRN